MIKISAVIITFNEEEHLEKCLKSLMGIVDEIIVVDSFSTDRTQDICKTFNTEFILQKFLGYIEQKNFALKHANYDHILDMDGDEALSDVSVNFVEVTDSDGVSDYLQIITGYPILDNSIDYYFGATSSTPYDFSTRTATGDVTLTLRVTPNSPLISQIKLRVTSGLP